MTPNLKIIRVRDFMRFIPEGTLNFAKAKEFLQETSSVSGAFVNYNLLIDTRGTETHLSVTDIWQLAAELAEIVHKDAKGFWAKIAVLYPPEHFDSAQFFELCGQNRGLNVHAFSSFEDLI